MAYLEAVTESRQGARGRRIKFTPERIQQIKDLVAQGVNGETIAALVGVTVGSLQVTCSRLRISLRRPKRPNGPRLRPPRIVHAGTAGSESPKFTICLQYQGREQETALPLSRSMAGKLALEASSRDQSISELTKDLLQAVARKGLFDDVLSKTDAV
jgi:hypothetical protein